MIRKSIILVSIVLGLISFFLLIGRNGVSPVVWLLFSMAPYLILGAIALIIKSTVMQTLLVPFLLFYGIGTLLNMPWQLEYGYAHVSAIIMLIMVCYFFIRNIIKLRFIRIALGLTVGIILFFLVKYTQEKLVDKKELEKLPRIDNRLLY